jgi:hypothetical protein
MSATGWLTIGGGRIVRRSARKQKRQAAQRVRAAARRAALNERMAGCVGRVSDIDPTTGMAEKQPMMTG